MPPLIEDRFAINDLFVRYTTALDAGDVDTIVACFTEDGALERMSRQLVAQIDALELPRLATVPSESAAFGEPGFVLDLPTFGRPAQEIAASLAEPRVPEWLMPAPPATK
jgi:hypothetical protein